MTHSVLLVGLGGFLGSVCRYGVQQYFLRYFPLSFPLGTFVVNVAGCLLIGLLLGLFERAAAPAAWRLFLATGFCGGFTTFSTFAHENILLARSGDLWVLAGYVAASLIVGMLAVALGLWVSRLGPA